MKINKLEIENVKRIKAVKLEMKENGLTVIGGNNNQGKTSVIDSIAWALGGDKYRPSNPQNNDSVVPPYLRVEMSNGLIVERKGKNSELKVTDPNGKKGGQQLLNEFVEQLAIDLPKFIESSSKEKANTLLQIIGVGDQLEKFENEEKTLYNRRLAIGQIADQKSKYAKEMIRYPEAPKEPVSITELIKQQQEILARNGENQKKRDNLLKLQSEHDELNRQIAVLTDRLNTVSADLEIAKKSAENIQDESTAELEQNIENIEKINIKVRANLDKDKAEDESEEYSAKYKVLTNRIDAIRQLKIDLLKTADLPLENLSVSDGELIYNGYKWDNMSGSDQLKVATAIVRKLNPNCEFVLIDKLEQMDKATMSEFENWLEKEGLQAIATRVSTGDECSIIIEDGYSTTANNTQKQWKAGEF